ncbi:hypothetical protein JTB14_026380 [Gonioctena quinquepunctata]|nr:hypothetical protein JTB14_026380 [Gonioctena quinquepunctata]
MACAGNSFDCGSKIKLDGFGSNYQSWMFQITILSKSEGIFDLVHKTRLILLEENDQKVWDKDDLRVQKFIVTSNNEKSISYLIACRSSSEMCIRIQALFGRSSEVSIHTLQEQFYYEGNGVAQHKAELQSLTHQLKSCSEEISENMLMNKILMMLPENFNHFYSASDSTAEKSLNILTTRLIIEEDRI